ncbi:phage terminase large subunit [Pimelobacter simplex]|uniref:phage terminase large subunit n=1 Tax=Nocardioides simplex TaxID=2045 RepID=UPI0036726787
MPSNSIGGIVPVEPDGGKEARAAAVSPLVEAGNVWLPSSELAPWADDVIEEAAGFPTAAHDDDIDAPAAGRRRGGRRTPTTSATGARWWGSPTASTRPSPTRTRRPGCRPTTSAGTSPSGSR